MINLWLFGVRVDLCQGVNRLIHLLRRFHIDLTSYENYSTKQAWRIVAVLFLGSKVLFLRLFYFVLVGACGFFAMKLWGGRPVDWLAFPDTASLAMAIMALWLTFSMWGMGITAATIHSDRKERTLVEYFCVKVCDYARTKIFFRQGIDLLLNLPFFLLIALLSGHAPAVFGNLLGLFTLKCFCGDVLGIAAPAGSKRRVVVRVGAMGLGMGVAYAYALVPAEVVQVLQNPMVLGFSVLLAGCFGRFLWCYQGYDHLFLRNIAASQAVLDKEKECLEQAQFGTAKKWDKGIVRDEDMSAQFPGKMGFDYLNAVFFHRHKKYFTLQLLRRAVLIALFCTAAIAIILIEDITVTAAQMEAHWDKAPALLFVIYGISLGRSVTSCVFLNCDMQMLHYVYFRSKETVLKSFKVRFLFTLKRNLLLTLELFVGLAAILFCLMDSPDLVRIGLGGLMLLAMGVFFSFNDLFIYYCLQPYDGDGNIQSWQYKIIHAAVYAVSYLNVRLQFPFEAYIGIVIAVTAVYLLWGLKVLPHIAPKHFQLR